MRRDGIQEFKAVLKQVITICIFETMYLFLSRNSYDFSRLAFLIFLVSSVVFLYAERMLWKTYLLKHKKVFYKKKSLLVITTSDRAEHTLKTIKNNTYN